MDGLLKYDPNHGNHGEFSSGGGSGEGGSSQPTQQQAEAVQQQNAQTLAAREALDTRAKAVSFSSHPKKAGHVSWYGRLPTGQEGPGYKQNLKYQAINARNAKSRGGLQGKSKLGKLLKGEVTAPIDLLKFNQPEYYHDAKTKKRFIKLPSGIGVDWQGKRPQIDKYANAVKRWLDQVKLNAQVQLRKRGSAKLAKADSLAKATPEEEAEAERIAAEIADALEMGDAELLVTLLDEVTTTAVRDGVEQTLGKMGLPDTNELFDRVDDYAVRWAEERSAELVGKRWIDGELEDNPNARMRIDETTRLMLRQTIADGLMDGFTMEEIAATLNDLFPFSEERAELIAATEINRAHSEGALKAAKDARDDLGIQSTKAWIVADTPCPICDANHEQGWIPLDDPFQSGDDASPAHPSCRCAIVFKAQLPSEAAAAAEDDDSEPINLMAKHLAILGDALVAELKGTPLLKYSEDQPRDDHGRWSAEGSSTDGKVEVPQRLIAGLPKSASQPFNTWDQLKAMGTQARDQMAEWLDKGSGVVSQMGGINKDMPRSKEEWQKLISETTGKPVLFIAPLKGEARATEKVVKEEGGDWSKLLDVTRGMIAVDKPSEVESVLRRLEQSGVNVARQAKDRINQSLPDGYRADVLLSPVMRNGMITELQVGVKKMFMTKETEGHAIYEHDRGITGKYVGKPESEWSAQDKLVHARNVSQMKDLYERTWNEVMAGSHSYNAHQIDKSEYFYVDVDGTTYRGTRTYMIVSDMWKNGAWVPSNLDTTTVLSSGPFTGPPGKGKE